MKSQAIVQYGAPLQEIERPAPQPQGSEVLLRVEHCGVCHSDVHLHDGYFDLGNGKRLDVSASHMLPLVPGHEIGGVVATAGPDAGELVYAGARRVVYPWIGCGDCPVCARGDEPLCPRPRQLGVNVDGGYSDCVLVPHPRYLLDYGQIPGALAATYMCSGLTAYSALQKVAPVPQGATIVLVGLGGVGMMGLQFARVLFPEARIAAVDVDAAKLQAAQAAGADAVYDASQEGAVKQLLKESGGAAAAVDFVGSENSLGFASRAVRRGGRVVIVGLFGGSLSMPIPMFPLRAIALMGSYVGTLAEAGAMLELVKAGVVAPIPLQERPLAQAGRVLDELRAGTVLGRVVLNCGG